MIRGQTPKEPNAVEDSVLNTRYVPVVPDAHKPNGKSGIGTDVNCPEKPRQVAPNDMKSSSIKVSRQSQPLKMKAYISRVPWQRSTSSKFEQAGSVDFEARFLGDPSALFAVCRVRIESVQPITNHRLNGNQPRNTIVRIAGGFLAIVKIDIGK